MTGDTGSLTTAEESPIARSTRTSGRADRRRLVVDAFIDLVLEHGGPPDPSEVAARAGVSRASFFRYFATLDELRTESAIRVVERFGDQFAIAEIGSGELDVRIERFVEVRVRLHEMLHALELLLRASAYRDHESAEQLRVGRDILANEITRHFAPELRDRTPAQRDDLVASIAVLTSVESWQQFRLHHGRSPMQTRRAWRTALAALFAPA